eukprot:Phypoly_transcript_12653.p1 GENE.Phypoly_transcript_12653~~Phypoly_transcript_12653.p1  ORF type:complete len:338 (+),score=65.48 Phypoly_transcript_12653:25-1014(+)
MAQTPAQEFELAAPPTDGITNVAFCSGTPLLLVSSWDQTVRIYDTQSNTPRTQYRHKAAVLDCCFVDKTRTFSGGMDRCLKMFDVPTGLETIIGDHEKAIKCVVHNPVDNSLYTGSWDYTVKLWDPRDHKLARVFHQLDRVYTMTLVGYKLVVGTAGRHVFIYDIRAMGVEPEQRRESSLKFQTRCVRGFVDGSGYALSSIEGRVAMEYFDPAQEVQAKKYAFKCHRTTANGVDTVYPVNALAFHPGYGTFASGGADGMVNIWDGNNKKRLCQFHRYDTSIASLAFDSTGQTLAIAVSYTFEEGEKDHPADAVFIRRVTDTEVKPKMRA